MEDGTSVRESHVCDRMKEGTPKEPVKLYTDIATADSDIRL